MSVNRMMVQSNEHLLTQVHTLKTIQIGNMASNWKWIRIKTEKAITKLLSKWIHLLLKAWTFPESVRRERGTIVDPTWSTAVQCCRPYPTMLCHTPIYLFLYVYGLMRYWLLSKRQAKASERVSKGAHCRCFSFDVIRLINFLSTRFFTDVLIISIIGILLCRNGVARLSNIFRTIFRMPIVLAVMLSVVFFSSAFFCLALYLFECVDVCVCVRVKFMVFPSELVFRPLLIEIVYHRWFIQSEFYAQCAL